MLCMLFGCPEAFAAELVVSTIRYWGFGSAKMGFWEKVCGL